MPIFQVIWVNSHSKLILVDKRNIIIFCQFLNFTMHSAPHLPMHANLVSPHRANKSLKLIEKFFEVCAQCLTSSNIHILPTV